MREAYNLFKNGGDPEKVFGDMFLDNLCSWFFFPTRYLNIGDCDKQLVNDFSSGQASDYFYASLYAGLYYEAEVWLRSWISQEQTA